MLFVLILSNRAASYGAIMAALPYMQLYIADCVMVDLRKAARGQMCTVRIPGYCNHDPETSVLAHYRLAGTCGIATKPHDMQAAIACSSCHDLIDGRVKTSDYTKEELRLMHAEGVFRTQEIWRKEGYL